MISMHPKSTSLSRSSNLSRAECQRCTLRQCIDIHILLILSNPYLAISRKICKVECSQLLTGRHHSSHHSSRQCSPHDECVAGNHPALDGSSRRRAEGVFPPLRHEDGEQPHRGDQIIAPGHHHVPGEDDGEGGDDAADDDDDDDDVQVHEQYAGQEEEWRHELRVRFKLKTPFFLFDI